MKIGRGVSVEAAGVRANLARVHRVRAIPRRDLQTCAILVREWSFAAQRPLRQSRFRSRVLVPHGALDHAESTATLAARKEVGPHDHCAN